MSTDDEKRSYQRGYVAGRKKNQKDVDSAARLAKRQYFLESAFLSALPACIEAHGWTRGGNELTSMKDKTDLAWEFAVEALRTRKYA